MATVDRPLPSSLSPRAPFGGRFGAAKEAAAPAAPAPEAAPRDRVLDLTALGLLAVCAFLIASLATFDPADPPAAREFPPHARATNACGLLGSTVATGLFESFGLGAWFVVGLLAGLDVMLLKRRSLPDLPLRAIGAVLATVGVCTLLAMFSPAWISRPLWGPGGSTGATGRLFAEAYFATAGATIIVTAITGAGLFLACDAVLLRAAAGARSLLAIVGGAGSALGRRLATRSASAGADTDMQVADPLAGFPGLRSRLASRLGEEAAPDGTAGDDGIEPAVRVRRREKPTIEADEFEAADEAAEDTDDASEASEDSEVVEEVRSAVPVRSLVNRRRKPEVLQMAPDPAADYELPSLELLLPAEQLQLDAQEQEVRERARVLEKTFADFGFKVRVVEIETGPVISQYEIELEAGLRLAKIANLADDLAIALRVPSVRIVAPIPGKNSVGVEVPNTDRQMVRLREVIEETQAKSRTMKIPIFLGKDVAGNPMVVDMASLPHLLIAGRTGTGKSVCLNSIIVSMLMTRRPDEVRMLMIDPKMVELTPYKALPHLMHPVVTDMKKAEAILAWAVEKMEERYTLLAKVGVRHLSQYNQLGREELIKRLAQKSRAVGIHLILATQKPTVDVITGLIKSNLPARIAFQVASRTDSRVVLDECGADRLLGNGDMLFLSPGTSQILRGQGTYVSDEEIGRVMAAVGTEEPQYAAELVNLQPAPSGDAPKGSAGKDRDEMYEAAVEVVIREGRGSVSLLQRALGVGYGRGARLIDFMAEDGIVGQYAGSQAREVLLTLEQWAERNGTTPLPADPAPRKLKIQPHATVATAPVDRDVDQDDEDDEEIDEELEGEDDVEEDWEDESDESSDLDAEDDADDADEDA